MPGDRVARIAAVRLLIVASVVASLALPLSGATPVTGADVSAGRWIVQVRTNARAAEVISSAPPAAGGRRLTATHLFSKVLNGFAAPLTAAQRGALIADPRVVAVVPDVAVQAAGEPYPLTDDEIQPGIRRVGVISNPDRPFEAGSTELDVDIAVLDTGIQPDNQELNVKGGYNCTDSTPEGGDPTEPLYWRDSVRSGHGTHVAGIAAARENGRGVAGVAQGARLWAIKVLDDGGSGYWSWVICGLDHVAQMREADNATVPQIEVVNMSLAATGADDGSCGYDIADMLHQAVCRVADEGITMVAAAGNAASNAAGFIPAAYDEVITVSAMADWNGAADGNDPSAPGSPPGNCWRTDGDDAFASFSNYGPDVDLIAPGVCVRSTLPVDDLGEMSGTSMATPHVAGAAALYYLAEQGAGRPRPTPEQVRAALVDRGTPDWQTDTDPDGQHEPALAASDLTVAADFQIGTSRDALRLPPGGSGSLEVWIARMHGFAAPVDLDVTSATLPIGVDAAFNGDPSQPPATEATLTMDVDTATAIGAHEIEVTAAAGVVIRSATFRLVVFATDGSAGAPYLKLIKGVESGAIAVPVRAKWGAVSNAQRYELQRSVDGAAWTTVAKPYGTKLDTSVWPGTRVQLRLRAKVGGTWRAWQTGRSSVVVPYEPIDPSVVLHGEWRFSPLAWSYSEYPQQSSMSGSTATFQFTGRSVAWITTKGATRGRARISLDGVTVATIDLYSSQTRHRQLVFAQSWATQAAHTLVIEVLGDPSGRPRIDLDALVVVSE